MNRWLIARIHLVLSAKISAICKTECIYDVENVMGKRGLVL